LNFAADGTIVSSPQEQTAPGPIDRRHEHGKNERDDLASAFNRQAPAAAIGLDPEMEFSTAAQASG